MANISGKPSKYCSVSMCTNTSVKTPQKLFIHMPNNPTVRKKWCSVIKTDMISLGLKTKRYCCEDHFDLENDVGNYTRFKINGGRLKLKKTVLPHKFECQNSVNDKKRDERADSEEGQNMEYFKRESSKIIGHEDLQSDTVVAVDTEAMTTNVPLNNIPNATEEVPQLNDIGETSQSQTKNKPKWPFYKYCCVPMCCNSSRSAPHKWYYQVPQDAGRRHKWLTAIGRQNDGLSPKSALYVCEDHFNLPDDHYMQYHVLEPSERPCLRLKPHVVPTRFACWTQSQAPVTKGNKTSNSADKPRTVTTSKRSKRGRRTALPKNNKLWQISIDNNPNQTKPPEPIDEPTTQTAKQLNEYKKNIEKGASPTKQLELIKQTLEQSLLSHTKLLESTVSRDNFHLPKKPKEQVPKKPKEKTAMEKMPRALREQEIRLVVAKSEQESNCESGKEKDVNEQDPLTLAKPNKSKKKDKSRSGKPKRPKCKQPADGCSQTHIQRTIKRDVSTKLESGEGMKPDDDGSISQIDDDIHQDNSCMLQCDDEEEFHQDDSMELEVEIQPDDDDATIMECEETECLISDASVKSERSASLAADKENEHEHVCRTCLCPCAEGMPLSARDQALGATLDSVLEEVTGLRVQHDEVPRALCLVCECSLRAAALFRRKAIHADRTLRAARPDARPASPRHQPQASHVDQPGQVEPSLQSHRSTGELTPTHDADDDDDERDGSRTPHPLPLPHQLNSDSDDFYWPEDKPPDCSPKRNSRRKTNKLHIDDIYNSQSDTDTDTDTDTPTLGRTVRGRGDRSRSWSPKSDKSTTDDTDTDTDTDADADEPKQKKRKMYPIKPKKYWKPKSGKYTKRELQCIECGFLTFNMYKLESHNRTHTGARPFACSLCDGRFAHQTTLTAHRRTHDRRRARSFVCHHCGRGFFRKCNLLNHMPMHSATKFVCSWCGHGFAWRCNLKAHLKRVHGGRTTP